MLFPKGRRHPKKRKKEMLPGRRHPKKGKEHLCEEDAVERFYESVSSPYCL
jgi:hypothetical protein